MYDTSLLYKKDYLTKQEIIELLDDIIPVIILLEEEIFVSNFIEECIKVYHLHGKSGDWTYEAARDKFLEKI